MGPLSNGLDGRAGELIIKGVCRAALAALWALGAATTGPACDANCQVARECLTGMALGKPGLTEPDDRSPLTVSHGQGGE